MLVVKGLTAVLAVLRQRQPVRRLSALNRAVLRFGAVSFVFLPTVLALAGQVDERLSLSVLPVALAGADRPSDLLRRGAFERLATLSACFCNWHDTPRFSDECVSVA